MIQQDRLSLGETDTAATRITRPRVACNPFATGTWTGQTLEALKVKRADENRVVIGFEDERSDTVAHINNVRERMFGIAPSDQNVLSAAVSEAARAQHIVNVKAA